MPFRWLLDRLFPVQATNRRDYDAWAARGFAAPSPPYIKRTVCLRAGLPGATWVETGTYRGETTAVLARVARRVYSIEPEPKLLARARARFLTTPNVEILGGLSEEILPALLPRISGDVCFWLDGHYSEGETFQGPKDTPIIEELAAIAAVAPRLDRLVVMVDDVRCFDPSQHGFADYPPKTYLIGWAERLGLVWHIEHDIFIAQR
jgi:hypothetical protein